MRREPVLDDRKTQRDAGAFDLHVAPEDRPTGFAAQPARVPPPRQEAARQQPARQDIVRRGAVRHEPTFEPRGVPGRETVAGGRPAAPSAAQGEPRFDGPAAPGVEENEPMATRATRSGGGGGRGRSGGGGGGGRKGRRRRRRSFLGHVVYLVFLLGLWGVIAAGGVVAYHFAQLPPIDQLTVPKRPPNVAIVAADGTLLANRGDMGGQAVSIKDLPPYLPKAFVAIEDRRFYSHFGVDPMGIARALARNVTHRGVSQGGSTLTQQLAKNLFLTQERTVSRKIQEAILALWLEQKFTKDQILELYLNRVYFGAGSYGVEAAALRYFGKPAKEVTLSEAAMIAGLVQAPSRLAPNRNAEGAQARAQLVLSAMAEEGFITEAQAKTALVNPATAIKPKGAGSMNYAADYVMDVLADFVGEIDRDIVVETTIDGRLQTAGERAIVDELNRNGAKFGVSQGALVSLAPDGAIKALIGGRNYGDSQFNRATVAKRQPGSSFKPFVFLAALENGLTPDTVREDGPVEYKGWQPENYSRRYSGPMTLTTALAHSINTVTARLVLEMGPKAVARTAQRLGITSNLQATPAIALGTAEVAPIELVAAYAAFANGGTGVIPYVIRQVKTTDGKSLYKRSPTDLGRVVDEPYLGMMNTMLRAVMTSGTGRKGAIPGWDLAGKSGTTQDYRDAWFVGYSSTLVTGVWLGNDNNSATKRVTGSNLPLSAWTNFMKAALQGQTPAPLPGEPWRRQVAPPAGEGQPMAGMPADADYVAAEPQAPAREMAAPAGGLRPPGSVGGGGAAPPRQRGLLEHLFGG